MLSIPNRIYVFPVDSLPEDKKWNFGTWESNISGETWGVWSKMIVFHKTDTDPSFHTVYNSAATHIYNMMLDCKDLEEAKRKLLTLL